MMKNASSPTASRRRLVPGIVAIVVVVVVTLAASQAGDGGGSASVAEIEAGPGRGEIVRVVDGDTVVVRIGGKEERVRLIGIDTPESVDPRSPVECFGQEASAHATGLLPPGTVVDLVRDVEGRDRYDRLLAYVYRVEDGEFINLRLVEDGYAAVATYPPNVAHTAELVAAAAKAREEGRGLWAACP